MKNEASWLMTIATILIVIGMFIGYSVEGIHKSPQEFLSRQIIVLTIAVIVFLCTVFAFWDAQKRLMKASVIFTLNAIVISLLILVLIIGESINGARRWILLPGGFSLQPSEFAKFIVVFDLAIYYSYFREKVSRFTYGVLIPSIIAGLYCGLIFMEKDLGTPVIILGCVLVLMLYVHVRISYLIPVFALAVIGIALGILAEPYRLERVLNTIFYTRDIKGAGAQIFQAMVAYYRGGLLGVGLGEGVSKMGVLPLPSRDFPFALWVEETGFVGGVILIALFFTFALVGLETTVKAPTFVTSILALGSTVMIVGQALIMILVNEGWLPVKGMCIPFVSSGGSSLVSNMVMLGCLVAIALQKTRSNEKKITTMPQIENPKTNS